jgi:hypothetical protein
MKQEKGYGWGQTSGEMYPWRRAPHEKHCCCRSFGQRRRTRGFESMDKSSCLKTLSEIVEPCISFCCYVAFITLGASTKKCKASCLPPASTSSQPPQPHSSTHPAPTPPSLAALTAVCERPAAAALPPPPSAATRWQRCGRGARLRRCQAGGLSQGP